MHHATATTTKTTPVGFEVFTTENAPAQTRAILQAVQNAFGGSLPNLFGVMAGSPQLLAGNGGLMKELEAISLSELEKQVIDLAVSERGHCDYCLAAHTFLSRRLPQEPVQAARSGRSISDPKLEALRKFAVEISEKHGFASESVRKTFLDHYSHQQALEVVLVVTVKILQNIVNNLAQTPIDLIFTGTQ